MTNNDEDTSRQAESLWRSDDWADLRWAREHSTPQQIARHLLDPQWRNRDYNALDELVEMTHDADLSSLSEDDLETLAASSLPELRQSVIRYKDTPARLLEDMARTESNTRLLQMLVESGRLSQNTIDLCCWNQTDSRLAASMLPKASDHLLVRLSGRDWWPSRKNAVESGRLDRARLSEMIEKENHPDVVSALIGTGEFDMDGEAKAIRRVITSPDLLTAYTNPMGRRYNLDRPGREVVRQAARTMLEHAPIGLILSMPDDDNENWRTLIDTAATEYADEINPNMLGLIAQAEGNNQTKTILGERLGKDALSGTDENQTPTASPGTGGTYGFNLRLLGRLKADVDYFLGPSHAEKYLWAGSVDAQIAKLREIDGNIRPEDRPEWFTTEWIDQAEQAMGTPADGGIEDALDAALSGQYAAFENAIIGYIDAHDPDAGTSENGASQFAGYEITDRAGNDSPTSYRLDWFDDEGLVHEGPKVTVKELTRMREGIFGSPDSWDSFGTTPSTSSAAASDVDFDSQERELAAQIIMQEGGTRQEVREQFTDEELDRIARDEMGAGTPEEADATKEKGVSDGGNGLTTKSVPTSGGPARPTVAATMEAEQLAFDFDDMPAELDFPQIQEENNSQTKLDMVSNLDSSRETEENDARKETTRNDGQVLPLPGGQEDEVPVHGGASAGTAQGAQETGDAGVGRLHGPGPEGLRPDDHRVRQPLGQDAPAPQAAGQLGPVVQGTQDGGASGRGDRHQERGRSPLTHIDRGLLDPDLQATGSSLERARANVCAIEVLRDLDDSGREPTDDDIRALAAYAGWGGAQKAFEEDGADPAWSEINTRLGELLTDAEYADARSSTLTAFYTPRPVVDAMWQALGKAGFGQDPKHPDMVLEPGCGTGNFIRSTPAGSSYGFTGIEADPISAGIARHLCADDDIINNRMERTGLPTDAFDLAVGNVPYSDAIRIDGTVIHDWFIQHSLDAVRPGGLVAVLTSRYTLDKNTSNMRRDLARKAELVAACRLPRETFDRQAGTEVVSDILILRKRDEPLAEADAAWTDTTEFRDGVNANRLFVDHPEYVAGTMAIGSGPFGPQIDVTGTGDITRLGEQVERILTGQLEQHGIDLHDRLGERANEPIVVPDKTQQAAMRYMVDANDHIWYGDMNGQIVPAHSRVAKGGDRRMASMLRLRDQAERLLAVERDPDTTDDAVAQGIRELDEAYDRFTASYGRLNSKENLRVFDPNNSDPSLNQLYTLEKTGSDGFEAKGDMLSKRVVTPMPPMPEHVDEPVEALAVSLDRVGHVDLDLIGHLLGTRDDLETVARLGDLIVTDPDDGTPLPADEYLSGDVGGELDHVDGLLRAMVDEPEQERVRAWLAENGIQAITPPSRVESCRRELIQAGAWQSATDPIHANKSVAEAPWFSNEFKEYGRGQRRAFACMFLDDCKPGVELLDKNWNAQQPKGNSLFYEVFDSGWSSDDGGTSNSAMRMLYKAVTADPEAIDDRTVATILNTSGFKHGPVQDALRKITDPSLWRVEDHGYYREAKCDYLALAKELRAHPETCEYLYAADADRLAHPTVEKRYGRYNSWNQKTFKPLDEVVDMEGLEQWRDRRATWMRDHPAEPADMDRLRSLQRLRGRLEQSMPVRLTHNDITAKLGSAWIPTGVIRDFMIETFGLETQPDITNDGRKVSLDPKLLDVADPDIQPMEGGKVQVCAEKIHEIWQEHAAEKATQLVFCDSSTTASGKWNIQSDLKRRLIDLGIPEDEIMFAAQEKDPQKKQALFEKVRKGEVRVLIGSTGTLGTGTNVQDRLFAIHDLDCPWKPAELEQRQGRVRRQGNMFDKAQDYRYVTVGTFDSYMFQTVERKARFISQIMSSGSPSREASDVDSTVLSLADMKAIATGDPNIAKRMELENQLTQMKLLKRAHADQQRSIRFKIDMQLQPTVDNLEKLHGEAVDDEPKFHKAVEIRDQHLAQGVCGLDLGDGPITDRKQAIHDLVGIAHRLDHGQTMEVGEYCGLTVMVASKNMAVKGINAFRPFVGLKGEHEHWAGTSVPDINNSADNVIRQLDRIIANNADTAQGLRVRLDNAKANLESAWNALNTPWEGQQEYDDLTDQIAKMNLEIKNSQDTAPAGEDEQDTQADLAKASYHSDGPAEAQAASVTVGFDPSEPSAFPTAAETTDIPMPDPCIDPSDDVSAGPGIGM